MCYIDFFTVTVYLNIIYTKQNSNIYFSKELNSSECQIISLLIVVPTDGEWERRKIEKSLDETIQLFFSCRMSLFF